MKYAAIKKLVSDAIAAQICTSDGIKRFVENDVRGEINPDDFDGVLERMRFEKRITLLNNGGFSAYFSADKLPTSFFRAGGGKINAIYDDPNVGLPVKVVSLDGLRDDFDFDEDDEIEVVRFFTEQELEQIENLTAENFSNKEIAARLGVQERLFSLRARFHLPTRQAISEGHKKRRNESAMSAKPSSSKPVEQPPQFAQRKPKQRVCDVRPAARLAITEFSETEASEPLTRRKSPPVEKPKRLCLCGEPLGARTKECRNCWLKRKEKPAVETKAKIETPTDRKIKEILKNENFDREKLLEIALDLFLEFSPPTIKEKFAEKLLEELETKNDSKIQGDYEH